MQALIDVILPVFLVIGFGYAATARGYFSDSAIDGIMKFAQQFAIPCLLFRAIATLDLGQEFSLTLLGSFYTGAFTCFLLGLFSGRFLFGRDWEDSVVIGFCCLFSNSVLLGLPITERAYGAAALGGNFAIVAIHAPFCYGIGITVMEIVRARGDSLRALPGRVLKAMFSNALILGILLGFAVNLSDTTIPSALAEAVDLMVRAALPAALFGLGGVLYRYKPEGDLKIVALVCVLALGLHPVIVMSLGQLGGLDRDALRSGVLTAAMAPGMNAYLFANIYGRARRVAATSVVVTTAASILTIWVWLSLLP